jgi:ribonuclease BN (tRNA processing enzyme)
VDDQQLQLTVLGSATPYPGPGNPCSGYLVSAGGCRLWVDAGTGTLVELRRHISLDQVDGIWISHLHADHCADLLTAYYGLLYADLRPARPIPLFGPPGIAARLAHFLTNTTTRSPVESAFAVEELHDGHHVKVQNLSLTTRSVTHGIPAFAVRIEHEDRSLVFSGDTAPCRGLTTLATGCDALLCEAGATSDTIDDPHHTPEDAGQTAHTADAGQLIVTHVGPFVTPDEAVTRAATRFASRIEYATPGTRFPIGPHTLEQRPIDVMPERR